MIFLYGLHTKPKAINFMNIVSKAIQIKGKTRAFFKQGVLFLVVYFLGTFSLKAETKKNLLPSPAQKTKKESAFENTSFEKSSLQESSLKKSKAKGADTQSKLLLAGPKQFLKERLLALSSEHPRIRSRAKTLLAKMKMAGYKDWIYPDPKFGIAWSNFPYRKDFPLQYDRTPMTGVEFKLSQPIPFPGKLTAEAGIAKADVRIARLRLAVEKNRIAKSFFGLLLRYRLQRNLLELSKGIARQVKLIALSSRNAYSVGRLTLDRVQFVDIANERFQDRIHSQQGALDAVFKKYDYFLPGQTGEAKVQELNLLVSKESLGGYLSSLDRLLSSKSFDLRKCSLAAALERSGAYREEKALTRSQLDYLPDTELFASFRKREPVEGDSVKGEDFFSFGFTMKIPLWSALSNHKNVASRRASMRARRFSEKDVLEQEDALLKSLKEDQATFERRLEHYNTRLVPRAERALESLQESYRSGRADLYDLLGAYEILYSLKSEALRLRNDRDASIIARAIIVNEILPEQNIRAEKVQGPLEEEEDYKGNDSNDGFNKNKKAQKNDTKEKSSVNDSVNDSMDNIEGKK